MLEIEPAFQMHPTLTANQPLDFLLPLAHQSYKPPTYRSHQERQEYGNHSSRSVRLPERSGWTAPSRDGLHTPPEEMTGANFNPPRPLPYGCHVPSNGYFPKPHGSSNGTGFGGFPPASFTGTSRNIEKVRGGPQSPAARRDLSAPPEQLQRRKSSCSNNSIVSYLQIPSSINDSKGSLAEFAAQITCLFWFESSFTLHRVEESRSIPIPTTPLVPDALPSMGFRKWVTTILSTTQVTQNVILLALLFIYRLKKLNPTVKGKRGSEFRLLTVALMLGNKFLDDNTYTNKTWAEVSGISVQEIHIMEVEFLSNMRYSLFTTDTEWRQWHVKLGRFWDYFEKASRTPLEVVPRALGPPTPSLNLSPTLPSPPTSTNASPPFQNTYSLGNTGYPPSVSVPPYFAPSIPPPSGLMPELDLRPTARKRIYEDYDLEPPAKRVTRSMAPSVPSSTTSTTLTPGTIQGLTPNLPRLPMPNLSINTNYSINSHAGQHSAHLPLPGGRAMSMVFPGLNNWPQANVVPSSVGTPSLNAYANTGSPYGNPNHTQRQSPYPIISANSSPTSAGFPQSSQPQNHVSPSVFLMQRNSPYKPVRNVNTLLVPPPSTSIHNQPQHIGYDQMHYQPLGKSERKTGLVPYMHHEAWPQMHQIPQWPSLAQSTYHN